MLNKRSAFVVGGGVAGLQATLDLANNGFGVCLVERQPRIGGFAPLLHEAFPTLENTERLVEPLFKIVIANPNVKIFSYSEVETVNGTMGNFKVKVLRKARHVNEQRCTNCGECEKVCPVDVPKDYEMGLTTRKAIYMPSPFPVPAKYLIDEATCLYFKDGSCHACRDACPEKAVVYEQKSVEEEIPADVIVLATGFQEYDARKVGQYKYGVYKNVITGMEYERLCNPTGPTKGKIVRIDNGEKPKSVVYILCVGSRDEKHLRYCCNIGCLNAIKHAYYSRAQYGEEVDAYVCYTDVRAVTKRGEQFYQRVRAMEVEFIHGQPSEIRETPNGSMIIDVYDQATSKLLSLTADLVVLETGLQPQVELRKKLKLDLDEDGFFTEKHAQLATNETSVAGIFLAGAVQQPMHINEAVVHASAAAIKAASSVRSKT